MKSNYSIHCLRVIYVTETFSKKRYDTKKRKE